MPTLADIYSGIATAKRQAGNFIRQPVSTLQEMVALANDAARQTNQQTALSAQGARRELRGQPMTQEQATADQELQQKLIDAANAGTLNVYPKIIDKLRNGDRLVEMPISLIEHGESAQRGGKLTWPGAKELIKEYAAKKTEAPPIKIISPEESGGKWMIEDGSHRFEAAKLNNKKTIKAIINRFDAESGGLDKLFKINQD